MSERSELISKLQNDHKFRESYIGSKLAVLVPAQIRALRLNSEMPRQADLAEAAEMKQSRISAIETPGATNFTLDTLVRLAAVFKVGLVVRFAPFEDMLRWDNSFSPDTFNVVRLDEDTAFLNGGLAADCNLLLEGAFIGQAAVTDAGFILPRNPAVEGNSQPASFGLAIQNIGFPATTATHTTQETENQPVAIGA